MGKDVCIKIYPSGKNLPLVKDANIQMVLERASFANISDFKNDYTLPIEIVETPELSEFFAELDSCDPKDVSGTVFCCGIPVLDFSGIKELSRSGNPCVRKLQLLGQTYEWTRLFKDKSLCEVIDFSKLDHTYDQTTIDALNAAAAANIDNQTQGVFYPKISWGGEKVIEGDIDNDFFDQLSYGFKDRPSFFVKWLLREAFESQGYSFKYKGDIANSREIQNLNIPYFSECLQAIDKPFQTGHNHVTGMPLDYIHPIEFENTTTLLPIGVTGSQVQSGNWTEADVIPVISGYGIKDKDDCRNQIRTDPLDCHIEYDEESELDFFPCNPQADPGFCSSTFKAKFEGKYGIKIRTCLEYWVLILIHIYDPDSGRVLGVSPSRFYRAFKIKKQKLFTEVADLLCGEEYNAQFESNITTGSAFDPSENQFNLAPEWEISIRTQENPDAATTLFNSQLSDGRELAEYLGWTIVNPGDENYPTNIFGSADNVIVYNTNLPGQPKYYLWSSPNSGVFIVDGIQHPIDPLQVIHFYTYNKFGSPEEMYEPQDLTVNFLASVSGAINASEVTVPHGPILHYYLEARTEEGECYDICNFTNSNLDININCPEIQIENLINYMQSSLGFYFITDENTKEICMIHRNDFHSGQSSYLVNTEDINNIINCGTQIESRISQKYKDNVCMEYDNDSEFSADSSLCISNTKETLDEDFGKSCIALRQTNSSEESIINDNGGFSATVMGNVGGCYVPIIGTERKKETKPRILTYCGDVTVSYDWLLSCGRFVVSDIPSTVIESISYFTFSGISGTITGSFDVTFGQGGVPALETAIINEGLGIHQVEFIESINQFAIYPGPSIQSGSIPISVIFTSIQINGDTYLLERCTSNPTYPFSYFYNDFQNGNGYSSTDLTNGSCDFSLMFGNDFGIGILDRYWSDYVKMIQCGLEVEANMYLDCADISELSFDNIKLFYDKFNNLQFHYLRSITYNVGSADLAKATFWRIQD